MNKFQPVYIRQEHMDENQIHALIVQEAPALIPACGDQDAIACLFKDCPEESPHWFIIINEQDGNHRSSSLFSSFIDRSRQTPYARLSHDTNKLPVSEVSASMTGR